MSTLCSQALVSVEAILHPRGPTFNDPLVPQVPPVTAASVEKQTPSVFTMPSVFNLPQPPSSTEIPLQSEAQPSTSQGDHSSAPKVLAVEMDSSSESSDQNEDDAVEIPQTKSNMSRTKETLSAATEANEGFSNETGETLEEDEIESSEHELSEKEEIVTEMQPSKIQPMCGNIEGTITEKMTPSHPQYTTISDDNKTALGTGGNLVPTKIDAGLDVNIIDDISYNNNQAQVKSSQTGEKRKLEETQDDQSIAKKLQVKCHVYVRVQYSVYVCMCHQVMLLWLNKRS